MSRGPGSGFFYSKNICWQLLRCAQSSPVISSEPLKYAQSSTDIGSGQLWAAQRRSALIVCRLWVAQGGSEPLRAAPSRASWLRIFSLEIYLQMGEDHQD